METLKAKSKSSVQNTKHQKSNSFDAALRGLGVRFQEEISVKKSKQKIELEKSK